jgi:hypothetical protein
MLRGKSVLWCRLGLEGEMVGKRGEVGGKGRKERGEHVRMCRKDRTRFEE